MSRVDQFCRTLTDITTLPPRRIAKGKETKIIAQAIYKRQITTIVGVKTTASRFLPVSHPGYSNETYVDKLHLIGKTRAEFIARKLKGTERRAHMTLFRQMMENFDRTKEPDEPNGSTNDAKSDRAAQPNRDWRTLFENRFGKACTIPDGLCIACWNCSLFGGLEAGQGATFSRIRYFDTFSVEDAAECVQTDDSPEQMAIGNTVGEDLSEERGEASFHRYEYVKPGTRFPFITIIESATLVDVAGYLAAVRLADQHGYGKYSASHGKFKTEFLAASTGYPLFSVLDMLGWLENPLTDLKDKLRFETPVGEPVTIPAHEIPGIQVRLSDEFNRYLSALNATNEDRVPRSKGRRRT